MKRSWLFLICLVALAPLDLLIAARADEDCRSIANVMQFPNTDRFLKQATLEMLRNYGCLGGPLAPAVEVDGQACQTGFKALASPYGDDFMKEALLESLRNRGCLNPHPSNPKTAKALYCLAFIRDVINSAATSKRSVLEQLQAGNLDARTKDEAKKTLESADQLNQGRLTRLEAFVKQLRVDGDLAAMSERMTKRYKSDWAACSSARAVLWKDSSFQQCLPNQVMAQDPLAGDPMVACAKQRNDEAARNVVTYCEKASNCGPFADSLAMSR